MYRYFLKLRPVAPGAVPDGFTACFNFDDKTMVDSVGFVWGWVEYDAPLSDGDIWRYDLIDSRLKDFYPVRVLVMDCVPVKYIIGKPARAVSLPETVEKLIKEGVIYTYYFDTCEARQQFIDDTFN